MTFLPSLGKAHFLLTLLAFGLFALFSAYRYFEFGGISDSALAQISWASFALLLLGLFFFLTNLCLFLAWQLIKVIGEKRRD